MSENTRYLSDKNVLLEMKIIEKGDIYFESVKKPVNI